MRKNITGKGLDTICQQEIIQNVTLFITQKAAVFYDRLFAHLDFTRPAAATGRQGCPKEAMVCAFIVNLLIAHYCGFHIMKPLPSNWTYARFLKKLDNGDLKEIMAQQVENCTNRGFWMRLSSDSIPSMLRRAQSRTIQNPLPKTSSNRKISRKPTRTVFWEFIPHPTSTTRGVMSFTGATKTMCWRTAFPVCLVQDCSF